ncbi:hypothetical protein BD309DRAFT_1023467 [Dichomitus squalens]|uniref:Uncharacterized protein n=1 Tax=Dichomitus squalens TaxID=114155 RepID=A0A4Q9PE61_9APHY|nr:hypothetical protein BD309DRAFT_1023467 [Dichomitus squalens]TBU53139.1 hypothetical protein BD310DRAFT_981348 [Dichomitus squalens]
MPFGPHTDPQIFESLNDLALIGCKTDILPNIDAVRGRLTSLVETPATEAKRFHYTVAHILFAVMVLRKYLFYYIWEGSIVQYSIPTVTIMVVLQVKSQVSKRFQRLLVSLHRYRNALVPINTLPDDVMLDIFREAAPRDVGHKHSILRTCTRWRHLSLSNTAFLTTLKLPEDPRELGPILDAARQLVPEPSLHLTIDWEDVRPSLVRSLRSTLSDNKSTMTKMTVSNLPRLYSQDWDSDSEDYDGSDAESEDLGELEELSLLEEFVPSLRALELRRSGQGLLRARDDCILPNVFGESGDKRLEVLILVNCRFPYTPRCYSGIRTLHIEFDSPPMRRRKKDRQWDGQFIDVLLTCPHLEHLVLRHVPMSLEEAIAHRPLFSVPLMNLRILRVDLDVQRVGGLLRGINTSAENLRVVDITLGDLNCCNTFNQSWTQAILRATLAPFSRFTLESLPVLKQLELLTMLRGMAVHGRGPLRRDPSGMHTASPRFDLRLTLPSDGSERDSMDSDISGGPTVSSDDGTMSIDSAVDNESPMNVAFDRFTDFLSQCSLHNVRTMRLYLFTPDMTLKVLRATPRIQELTLDDPTIMVEIASASAKAHTYRSMCPRLETITLERCTLRGDQLSAICRAAGVLELRTLTLAQCDSELEPMNVLRGLGRHGLNVRWLEDLPTDELCRDQFQFN